jgi:N-acetylmuramoyl-L-alanine amidase
MSDGDESRRAAGREPPGGEAGEPSSAGPVEPFGLDPTGGPSSGDPEDALRSLEKLEALSRGERPAPVSAPAPPRRRATRVAAPSRPTGGWARYAAPVAFLVAVVALVSVAFQSGVLGGGGEEKGTTPAPKVTKSPKPSASAKASVKPSAKASATPSAAASGTATYTVKAGDTLSGIAGRFGTSVTGIEELNPDADLTTLHPGQKLIVPAT